MPRKKPDERVAKTGIYLCEDCGRPRHRQGGRHVCRPPVRGAAQAPQAGGPAVPGSARPAKEPQDYDEENDDEDDQDVNGDANRKRRRPDYDDDEDGDEDDSEFLDDVAFAGDGSEHDEPLLRRSDVEIEAERRALESFIAVDEETAAELCREAHKYRPDVKYASRAGPVSNVYFLPDAGHPVAVPEAARDPAKKRNPFVSDIEQRFVTFLAGDRTGDSKGNEIIGVLIDAITQAAEEGPDGILSLKNMDEVHRKLVESGELSSWMCTNILYTDEEGNDAELPFYHKNPLEVFLRDFSAPQFASKLILGPTFRFDKDGDRVFDEVSDSFKYHEHQKKLPKGAVQGLVLWGTDGTTLGNLNKTTVRPLYQRCCNINKRCGNKHKSGAISLIALFPRLPDMKSSSKEKRKRFKMEVLHRCLGVLGSFFKDIGDEYVVKRGNHVASSAI